MMCCGDKIKKQVEPGKAGAQAECCGLSNEARMKANPCTSAQGDCAEGMKAMMSECCAGTKACRWFPAIPIALGTIAFLLGCFLSPEVVRVFWLIISGAMVLMGLIGFALMGSVFRGKARPGTEE